MSVLSDGMINRAFKSHTLTGQRVFVKCVHHVFAEEGQTVLSLAESVIEIRCQRETATIQYDAGRDIYLGYRNATKYYPVYGASQILAGYAVSYTHLEGADRAELSSSVDCLLGTFQRNHGCERGERRTAGESPQIEQSVS